MPLLDLGALDCLVNNVGLAYDSDFLQVTDEEWDELWRVNVLSYVRAIRAAVPAMREHGAGVIVNVSSTAGKRPSTSMPHYSVTKGGPRSSGWWPTCTRKTELLQRRHAWSDGDGHLAGRRRPRRPAGDAD